MTSIMEDDMDLRKSIRAAIKRKLQELGPCVDEELTDYIMVLLANKKNAHQMAEDLSVFLGCNSIKFTLWLYGVLQKVNSMAIGPGSSTPHDPQAASSVSIGPADGGRRELQASTLSSARSHSVDAPLSISSILAHYRNCLTEKNVPHRVSSTVQPQSGHLYSDPGFRVEPGPGKAPAAAFTVPCGLGWPSQGDGHQLSPSQAPDGRLGLRSSEPAQGVDQPPRDYRVPQDSCPTGDPVTRTSRARGYREKCTSYVEHQGSNAGRSRSSASRPLLGRSDERGGQSGVNPKFIVTLDRAPNPLPKQEHDGRVDESELHYSNESEVGGPSDSHCRMRRKPLVGGSVRRKEATTAEEEALVSNPHVVQGRRDERKCQSAVRPKFIVTLGRAPNPSRRLEDDGRRDESESYYSDEVNGSKRAKRQKLRERCRFWPSCESGDKCLYHHPIAKCKTFPHCSFGDKCLFIHPDCKYDAECTRADCPYSHSSRRSLTPLSKLEGKLAPNLCRFFPECEKMDCQFHHPKPCRFKTKCKRADCYFYHPPVPSGHAKMEQIP